MVGGPRPRFRDVIDLLSNVVEILRIADVVGVMMECLRPRNFLTVLVTTLIILCDSNHQTLKLHGNRVRTNNQLV